MNFFNLFKNKIFSRARRGFSLIEISIVIIIISIIISLAIPLTTAQTESENIQETRARLNVISAALAAYVGVNNSLPCPARINVARNTANFSTATDCTVAAVAGVTNVTSGADNIRIGGVPAKTLNIPEKYTYDAWGRRFTYVIDKALATGVGTMTTAGHINITDASGNALTSPAATGAYFVFSSGKDGKGAYSINGANPTVLCGSTAKDSENCDGDFQFIDAAYNDGTVAANFYDDLVTWRTNSLGGTVVSTVLPSCTAGQSLISNGSGGFNCMTIPPTCATGEMIYWTGSAWACRPGFPTCSTTDMIYWTGSAWACRAGIPSCSTSQMIYWTGSAWACRAGFPTCATNEMIYWTGSAWGCKAGLPSTCTTNQIMAWNGTAWACSDFFSGVSTGGGAGYTQLTGSTVSNSTNYTIPAGTKWIWVAAGCAAASTGGSYSEVQVGIPGNGTWDMCFASISGTTNDQDRATAAFPAPAGGGTVTIYRNLVGNDQPGGAAGAAVSFFK